MLKIYKLYGCLLLLACTSTQFRSITTVAPSKVWVCTVNKVVADSKVTFKLVSSDDSAALVATDLNLKKPEAQIKDLFGSNSPEPKAIKFQEQRGFKAVIQQLCKLNWTSNPNAFVFVDYDKENKCLTLTTKGGGITADQLEDRPHFSEKVLQAYPPFLANPVNRFSACMGIQSAVLVLMTKTGGVAKTTEQIIKLLLKILPLDLWITSTTYMKDFAKISIVVSLGTMALLSALVAAPRLNKLILSYLRSQVAKEEGYLDRAKLACSGPYVEQDLLSLLTSFNDNAVTAPKLPAMCLKEGVVSVALTSLTYLTMFTVIFGGALIKATPVYRERQNGEAGGAATLSSDDAQIAFVRLWREI